MHTFVWLIRQLIRLISNNFNFLCFLAVVIIKNQPRINHFNLNFILTYNRQCIRELLYDKMQKGCTCTLPRLQKFLSCGQCNLDAFVSVTSLKWKMKVKAWESCSGTKKGSCSEMERKWYTEFLVRTSVRVVSFSLWI